jgi:hypothetical protein
MKHLTTLLIILGLFSCREKGKENEKEEYAKQTDLRRSAIQKYFKGLKKTKETKFGGGDGSGTTYIFNNADSSITRVIVEYYAGDYGNGSNEFLLADNRLIYQRDSIVDWLAIKSPLDSSNYKLSEVVSYYNIDSTGTKFSKEVYLLTLDFNEDKRKELETKKTDSLTLTKEDYIKSLEELKEALKLKLLEE